MARLSCSRKSTIRTPAPSLESGDNSPARPFKVCSMRHFGEATRFYFSLHFNRRFGHKTIT